jgi:NAD(P)H-dependent FMN reductase
MPGERSSFHRSGTPAICTAVSLTAALDVRNHAARMPDERVAVIIGSTRPTRICPAIAGWAQQALAQQSVLRYELVDLAEINLPLLDEPFKAAQNDYKHEHTKAWSRLVSSFDGFVFVAPQYNWGYPAALKNALDYLYFEWHDKPVTTVTYGTRGGGKGADQLRGVIDGLRMRALPDRLEVSIADDQVDQDWQLKDLEATMSPYRDRLHQIDAQMIEALEDNN